MAALCGGLHANRNRDLLNERKLCNSRIEPKMIKHFDGWLIGSLYQRLINWSQRGPMWWVEQSSTAMLVLSVLRFAMTENTNTSSYLNLVVGVIMSSMFFFLARVQGLLASMAANYGLRVLVLGLSTISATLYLVNLVLCLALFKSIHLPLINAGFQLAFVSVYYFAACKLPPPREPKKEPKSNMVPAT